MHKNTLLNITFPVYNEENDLGKNIIKFYNYLKETSFPYKFEIIIADNASTDKTKEIAQKLAREIKEVDYIYLDKKGRNHALKAIWTKTNANIVSYMDIDLSTDLSFFLPLIQKITEENYDLSIGNRLGKQSKVTNRNSLRTFLSISYNLLLRFVFWHNIQDHQCGFKAIKKEAFLNLNKQIPDIKKEIWFLDTELIIRAIKNNMKVAQIDIIWKDDPNSKVELKKIIIENLKGIIRLMRDF